MNNDAALVAEQNHALGTDIPKRPKRKRKGMRRPDSRFQSKGRFTVSYGIEGSLSMPALTLSG